MRSLLFVLFFLGSSVASAQWFYQPIEHNPVYRGYYTGVVYPSSGYYGGYYGGYGTVHQPIEVRVRWDATDPLGPNGRLGSGRFYGRRGW